MLSRRLHTILPSTKLHAKIRFIGRRSIFATNLNQNHNNPLGLPKNNTRIPPQIPRKGPIGGGLPPKQKIPNVKHVVLVSSCKGGIGKSTISVNLAVSLSLLNLSQLRRLRVGILDLDVFGPSVPTLMGLRGVEEPGLMKTGALIPITNHGIPTMSMAYLLPPSQGVSSEGDAEPTNEDTPVVWRGLMVQKAVQQLLFQTDWSAFEGGQSGGPGLDVLVVDLPPGTGDIPLSVSQLVDVNSTIIITTADILSLSDVRRGVAMFQKLEMPITGLVVNNSYFICENDGCGMKHHLYGHDINNNQSGFHKGVRAMGLGGNKIVGELPLVADVGRGAERGIPYALGGVNQTVGAGKLWKDAMKGVAERVWAEIVSVGERRM
ncbi:hypothetical protein GYMLUDRAFT_50899 [Collybiopsis luxurians FD-317 M1]|uniref:P-loop containing nucleoside triphosphate hydrolase protein n=1 Tax=Collybiopsis luxurians FD-317 M1 TaxID=944289 RepID=A0A0D0BN93_9AGAR|nr:hypothetical protein GYMLUDRAFT_50899 [Collybiopsis luxurians FD-317 M1]